MDLKELTTFNGTPLESILKNLPDIDESINKENIETFSKFETFSSDEKRHTCVLCGKKTCIDDSISHRGHKLICISAPYTYFDGDYAIASRWQMRKELNEQ